MLLCPSISWAMWGGIPFRMALVADAVVGDGPVLQADDPLEQQRHRRVPGALARVIGGD
jgi:hypothetical protein